MLPIQVMNATSESFFHKKLLKLGLGAIPIVGPGLSSLVNGGGGGGGGMPTLQTFAPTAPAPAFTGPRAAGGFKGSRLAHIAKHIAHGHAIKLLKGTGGHAVAEKGIVDFSMGGPCAQGQVRDADGNCVGFQTTSPREMQEGGFEAVAGAFGMPAFAPARRDVLTWVCPTGMVLGRDNLCYPKQVLRRDSRFRKWRPGMRPVLTGGERRGISKARRSIIRAKEATADLGISVKKR